VRTINDAGLDLIKSFEGCAKKRPDGKFQAYPDPGSGGDPWTIGWGATGADVTPGTVWTQAQCDERLAADAGRFAAAVARALGDVPTTDNQFAAMVSFHYNTGKLLASTLFRKHKAGDYAAARLEFDRWVFAAGKRMNGLVRRRKAEAELYERA